MRNDGVRTCAVSIGVSVLLCVSAYADTVTRPLRAYGNGIAYDVAVSPDGSKAAIGADGATLVDLETGTILGRFLGDRGSSFAVAFSPDGTKLLTGGVSENFIAQLWDITSGELLRNFVGHLWIISDVAFSPDGDTVLTASWDGEARLWEESTGALLQSFAGHNEEPLTSIAFSPDGTQILTGSEDDTAKLWDIESGLAVGTFSDHTDDVLSVAFSPDGTRVATSSADQTAILWNASTGGSLQTFVGHTDVVGAVAFSPDGTLVATGSGLGDALENTDGSIKLWNPENGQEIRTLTGHTEAVNTVVFTPGGTTLLSASGDTLNLRAVDSRATLWEVATGAEIRNYKAHSGPVNSVAFMPDGARFVTGSSDFTAKLWETETAIELRTFEGHTQAVASHAITANGARLVTASWDGTARVWNIASGELLNTYTEHNGGVNAVKIHPLGALAATGSQDSLARLWDLDSGDTVQTFTGHVGSINSLAFSPDGTRLLTSAEPWSSDPGAILWDVETGDEIRTFPGHSDRIRAVAYSPDGLKVLTGSADFTAKLWDVETGQELLTLNGHTDDVKGVGFSPDGSLLLTASRDATARLWDATTGTELRKFDRHTSFVNAAIFSPDGSRILTGSEDTVAFIWDASGQAGTDTLSNGTCDTAVELVGDFSARGDTSLNGLVTDDYVPAGDCAPPFEGTGDGPDVAFSYTPDAAGTYEFTLLPDSADLALYLVESCEDISNTCLALEDSAGRGGADKISVALEEGSTYYIIVDGYGNQRGAFTLTGRFVPEAPEQTAVVDGVVRHRNTNAALSGVRVEAVSSASNTVPLASANTLISGEYELELPEGDAPYDVSFALPGYDSRTIENIPGGQTLDVTLVPAAPEPPTDLAFVPGTNRVRLAWSPNAESDLAGYHAYRNLASESVLNRTRLNTNLISQPVFTDTSIELNVEYEYRVTAVDVDGNESALSSPLTAQVEALRLHIPDVDAFTSDETVRVQIAVSNADGLSPNGIQLDFRYPAAAVDMSSVDVEKSALMRFTSPQYNTGLPGQVIITTLGETPLSGEGHLFDVFLPIAAGATPSDGGVLSLNDAVFSDEFGNSIPVDFSDTGTLTLFDPNVKGMETEICREGDMNNDGIVNILDAVVLLRASVELIPVTECLLQSGDLDADMDLSSADALLLQRIVAQLDINPPQTKNTQRSRSLPLGLKVSRVAAAAGNLVTVFVEAINAQQLAGLDLEIGYPDDVTLLDLVSVSTGDLTSGFQVLSSTKRAGAIRLSLARSTPLAEEERSGTVLELQFRVGDGVPSGEVLPVTVNAAGVRGEYGESFAWYTEVGSCNGSVTVGDLPQPDDCELVVIIEGEDEGEAATDGEGSSEGATEGSASDGEMDGELTGDGEGNAPEGEAEEADGEVMGDGEGGALEGEAEGFLGREGQGEGNACADVGGHAADWDQSDTIDLSELLRVVQLFNVGSFYCADGQAESDDGFVPGEDVLRDCCPHDSDYLPAIAPDWSISLEELLRLIQFYNAGGFLPCGEGEDGFCLGE